MIIAAAAGRTDIVRILISKGADINAKNNGGHSALQYAASKNYPDVSNFHYLYCGDIDLFQFGNEFVVI